MPDIDLLHLWRGSWIFNTNNQYQMSDQTRTALLEQQMFARSNGTMERFRVRVAVNNSSSALSFKFLLNNVVERTIGPLLVGQLGVFLPDNQLPLSFEKSDLLVMQITGLTPSAGGNSIEWNCDLKFDLL